jgi:hypothetical protein
MSDATPPTPSYAPAPAAGKTNTLAIVALILGILVPLGGVICGPIALSQIKRTGENGRGLALAGTIIGAVLIALYIIIWIIAGIALATAGTVSTY